jgi:hypothetical protein
LARLAHDPRLLLVREPGSSSSLVSPDEAPSFIRNGPVFLVQVSAIVTTMDRVSHKAMGRGSTGGVVANLHRMLRTPGLESSGPEMERRLFRPATELPLRRWQRANGQEPTGILTEAVGVALGVDLDLPALNQELEGSEKGKVRLPRSKGRRAGAGKGAEQ